MKVFLKKLWDKRPTKRRWMQLYAALLFNANFKGFTEGMIHTGESKRVCVPGLNCYSCPGAVGACPLGSLQGAFSADKSTLFYIGGILLLYCVLAGRMICGWLCPFGLIQELLYKVKTPKVKKNKVTRVLSYFKYVVLVFFVVIVPLLYAFRDTPLPAFCKYICPVGTLEAGIPLVITNPELQSAIGWHYVWKIAILIVILLASVIMYRPFCRYLCPLGAVYGLFNRFAIYRYHIDSEKCVECGVCQTACKLDIPVWKKPNSIDCIRCGECRNACPTGAIKNMYRRNP